MPPNDVQKLSQVLMGTIITDHDVCSILEAASSAPLSHGCSFQARSNISSPSDDKDELTSFPASLTMLDAFASEWAIKENTGSTIRTIFSIDEISSLLSGGGSEARCEFGLIMLRLSASENIPVEIVLVLQKVFRDLLKMQHSQFESRPQSYFFKSSR
jgi:hypothetical protein